MEKDLTPETLREAVVSLLDHPQRREEMSRQMRSLGVQGSTDKIMEEIYRVLK